MSLARAAIPNNVGVKTDPPGTTGPDSQYVQQPASARLPECDLPPGIVGGADPDPQYD